MQETKELPEAVSDFKVREKVVPTIPPAQSDPGIQTHVSQGGYLDGKAIEGIPVVVVNSAMEKMQSSDSFNWIELIGVLVPALWPLLIAGILFFLRNKLLQLADVFIQAAKKAKNIKLPGVGLEDVQTQSVEEQKEGIESDRKSVFLDDKGGIDVDTPTPTPTASTSSPEKKYAVHKALVLKDLALRKLQALRDTKILRQVKLVKTGVEIDAAYIADGRLCAVEVKHLSSPFRSEFRRRRRDIYTKLVGEFVRAHVFDALIEFIFIVDDGFPPEQVAKLEETRYVSDVEIRTTVFRSEDLLAEFGVEG
jgi:hypothetical protein